MRRGAERRGFDAAILAHPGRWHLFWSTAITRTRADYLPDGPIDPGARITAGTQRPAADRTESAPGAGLRRAGPPCSWSVQSCSASTPRARRLASGRSKQQSASDRIGVGGREVSCSRIARTRASRPARQFRRPRRVHAGSRRRRRASVLTGRGDGSRTPGPGQGKAGAGWTGFFSRNAVCPLIRLAQPSGDMATPSPLPTGFSFLDGRRIRRSWSPCARAGPHRPPSPIATALRDRMAPRHVRDGRTRPREEGRAPLASLRRE